MNINEKYILPYPCRSVNGVIQFQLPHEIVEIAIEDDLFNEVVRLSDGFTVWGDVLKSATLWSQDILDDFGAHLYETGILVSVKKALAALMSYGDNPTHYIETVTDEQADQYAAQSVQMNVNMSDEGITLEVECERSSLQKRRSVRLFGDDSIFVDELSFMLWECYGVISEHDGFNRRTIPSAGALYPLRIHLCLLQDIQKSTDNNEIILHKGIYDIVYCGIGKVSFIWKSEVSSKVLRSFVSPTDVHNASGFIVISDTMFSTEKYGARGTRYALIESGHVAQNFLRSAQDIGVGAVEIGGFFEHKLREVFQTENNPLISVVFGKEGDVDSLYDRKSVNSKWVSMLPHLSYEPPFSLAVARVETPNYVASSWSSGRSADPALAQLKAVVEAQEWYAYELTEGMGMIHGRSFQDLDHVIHPTSVMSFHDIQFSENFPYREFKEDELYDWVSVKEYASDREVFMLADLIFFGYRSQSQSFDCYKANSSGGAAHFDVNLAQQGAALELVERDAFMIIWLNQLVMPTVLHECIPEELMKRITAMSQVGFDITIKDISIGLAPVVMVCAQSQDLHYTTVAAASDFSPEKALDHALMEVESSVYFRLSMGVGDIIQPTEVDSPDDHGRLYESLEHFQKADVLIEKGDEITDMHDIGKGSARTWDDFVRMLESEDLKMYFFNHSQKSNKIVDPNLHITRCFIPGLVPINFGYNEEPLGMDRIYSVPVNRGLRSEMVAYQDIPKYPHPFN